MVTTAMDAATRGRELPAVFAAGWKMMETREALIKSYEFADFNQTWQWMSSVALASKKLHHHPEWRSTYSTAEVIWSTHDENGDIPISIRDIDMAKSCDLAYKLLGDTKPKVETKE